MEKNQNNQGLQQPGSKESQIAKEEVKKTFDPNNPTANKNQQAPSSSEAKTHADVLEKEEDREETAEETSDSDSVQNEKKDSNQKSNKAIL